MSEIIKLQDFIQINSLFHKNKINFENPFKLLGKNLNIWIESLLNELDVEGSPVIKGTISANCFITGRVYIAKGAKVDDTAKIEGPCYIGESAEVRHGAFIRGNVYAGPGSVIGHATEVKNAVFFDGAKAGHFAYVGDSILGQNVNLGAGTKLANLKFKKNEVRFINPSSGKPVGSGLKKFGAIMGDNSQTGCNSVLDPGTLLFPNTGVLPCIHFRGTLKNGVAK